MRLVPGSGATVSCIDGLRRASCIAKGHEMSILESLLSAGNGAALNQLAGQFGISAEQTTSVMSALLPALASGVKEKIASPDGGALSELIGGGSLTRFATDPSTLATPAAMEQGRSLLSQLFGSQELSGMIASVAEKAGVDSSIVTKLLPIAASLLGGLLAKNSAEGGNITDMVGQIESAGSSGILGAVKGLAAKLFG